MRKFHTISCEMKKMIVVYSPDFLLIYVVDELYLYGDHYMIWRKQYHRSIQTWNHAPNQPHGNRYRTSSYVFLLSFFICVQQIFFVIFQIALFYLFDEKYCKNRNWGRKNKRESGPRDIFFFSPYGGNVRK